jgi:hypothetical protein
MICDIRNYVFTFFFFFFILSTYCARAQYPQLDTKGNLTDMEEVDISLMVQPLPIENKFLDSAYNIWCGSVIKAGKD